ncbi:MAG TPA: cob(I)yrinic acid a,c-diamide adenosyltransferase [Candidatus Paceibacterota bacterium]|nr:cob(I)yrinic acid a,c-diamide adenosyltransferase [Candidatus Paceibacterota bacterium]
MAYMLYTGKGDGGTTTAFGCDQKRISKSSELPEALGTLDELNAFLGFVKLCAADNDRIARVLRDVQETLFIIQAEVAGAEKQVGEHAVKEIEDITNGIEREIPPLKGFSIAGGTELSALLDVARTLARRAERRLIAVAEVGVHDIPPETKSYMNRLSSLLFALARLANHQAGVAEENPRY